MNLPQFVELDKVRSNTQGTIERLDELRLKLNEALQDSIVNDGSGLISLKDIMRKGKNDAS